MNPHTVVVVAVMTMISICGASATPRGDVDSPRAPAVALADSAPLSPRHTAAFGRRGGPARANGAMPPPMRYMNQSVDHFGSTPDTFAQRYVVDNSSFVPGSDAPVFLLVGGEYELEEWWTILAEPRELAKSMGALIVLLEHRHFGLSVPYGTLSAKSLQFLSLQQALGDIEKFVPYVSLEEGLSPTSNRWIAWGCSYSGVVSALARLTLPDVIYATVASSAPVEAVVEFAAYNKIVHQALASKITGGSPTCANLTVAAFDELAALLDGPGGYDTVADMFNSCTPLGPSDRGTIERALLDLFIGSNFVQENLPYDLIAHYCYAMTHPQASTGEASSSALQALADLVAAFQRGACYDNLSHSGFMQALSNETVDAASWGRQYQWLKCTQVGWFHTCSVEGGCPFAPSIPLSHVIAACDIVFGKSPADVEAAVAATNAVFGGNNPTNATRLLFVNGQFDPWHALSVTYQQPGNAPPVMISDGCHCANCAASNKLDTLPVVEARETIAEQVKAWLVAPAN